MTAPEDRSVAVIVVNWNGWRMSIDCLHSLRTSKNADWHLFLVDNASTDDSRDHLGNLGDDVTLIMSPNNGGWTGGNNIGICTALQSEYSHFLFLNNDAMVGPHTLSCLLDTFKSSVSQPILGPIHRDPLGNLDFVGATIDRRTGRPSEMHASEIDHASSSMTYPTAYIRGAALFAHREHLATVGLFDDQFYLYYDDTDWCFRARSMGYAIEMVRDAEVTHIGSASVGHISPLWIYFMVRNGLLFVERHGGPLQRIRYAVWLVRWLAVFFEGHARLPRLASMLYGKRDIAVAARRGLRDYLTRRFGDCPKLIRRLSGMLVE